MKGLSYFLRGFQLIQQPGLRRFYLVPLIANTVMFILAIVVLVHYFELAMQHFIPDWLSWLSFLLWPIFAIGVLAGVFFCFSLMANLIAAPFYGRLAAAVEQKLTGQTITNSVDGPVFQNLVHDITLELRKIIYYLTRAIPLLLLSLIPGLNLITFPLWLMFSAWFLAYDAATYPLENHRFDFNQQRMVLKQFRWSMLSYGGMNMGAAIIPIVNLISPAAAVAGMTSLFYDQGVLTQTSDSKGSAISVPRD